MKTTRQEPIIPQSKEVQKGSNGEALQKVASALTTEVIDNIESGNLDAVEATGNLSLSILLTKYSEGLLTEREAFAFFKEMASKKTQAPVQRVEQHVKIDLRAVFNDITSNNQDIRSNRIEQATAQDQDVVKRLQLDEDMMLLPRDEEAASKPTFTPDPPPEIEDIRTGGDGSERRQRWEKQGAKTPSYRKTDNE